MIPLSAEPSNVKRAEPDGEYFGAQEKHMAAQPQLYPRVRFAQEVPTIRYFDDDLAPEEHGHVWYNREDYDKFHHLAKQQGIAIMIEQQQRSATKKDLWGGLIGISSQKKKSWRDSILTAYLAFRQLQSNEEISAALGKLSNITTMNEHTVGIVPYAVPEIMQDFVMLRRHAVMKVDSFQRATLKDGQDRTDMIRDQCRWTSQASRLFAQYTAQLAAETAV